jgi:predicted AAA+ superfamily ATPase
MNVDRSAKDEIIETLQFSPVVLINGARQSGKSTLAKELITEGYLFDYITLDNPSVLSNLLSSPIAFLEDLKHGTVIDEIQRAAEIFTSIKYVVDKDRKPGKFLLTGSANVLLLPKLSDSLAGRIAIYTLKPFSQGEIQGRKEDFIDWLFSDDFDHFKVKANVSMSNLQTRIIKGSYPEPLVGKFSESQQMHWYESYLNTLLVRDVRDLANLEQIGLVPQLFKLLASRTSNLLNYSDLSRSLDFPQTTLKRYLSLLQSLYLVDFLEPWYTNFGKRLIKSPKIHLNDTGFSLHLLGQNLESLKKDRILFGQILENFIYLELTKQAGWSKTKPQTYHYRTQNGEEIDFIMEARNSKLVAIEVKASSSFDPKDLKAIKDFKKAVGDRFHRGIIFHTGQEVYKIDEKLYILPIQALWEQRVRF